MKNLIYTLVLFLALTVFFSCLGYYPTETKENIGSGTQYKGDSGLIIPGDGELLAEVIIQPESIPEPAGDEPTEEAKTAEAAKVETSEEIKEEHNRMDGMLIAFWHGVAAVLIGEACAILIGTAWMKIHKHFPNGNANKN